MKSSLLIAFLREKNGFRCGFESSQSCRCCFQHTCVFVVSVCYLLLPDLRVLFFLRAPPNRRRRPRWTQGEFAIILLFYRHLSAIVVSCDKKNEKKCVNRNRFEICVKLLNTKVTEKSRSIFILYIVIIRKSVRLVLQEKTRVWLKRNENTERGKPRHRRIS